MAALPHADCGVAGVSVDGSRRGKDNRASAHGEVELCFSALHRWAFSFLARSCGGGVASADAVHDDGKCDGESDNEGCFLCT
jgi:hypothetical protein